MKLETSQLASWVEMALQKPDSAWLVDGIVPAGGLTVISGRPKLSKKSWLAYIIAMCISSGKSIAGLDIPEQKRVLLLSLEGSEKPTAERFPLLARGHGIALEECDFLISHGNPFLIDHPDYIRELCEFVAEQGIKCVIIDTFARSFIGDENSAKDVGAAMRGVERVLALGCAVVLVHHVKKEQTGGGYALFDPDSALRGSSALAGAFDSLIAIKSIPNEDGNGFDSWAIVGGKIREYQAYEINWQIDSNKASLTMDGPGDLPEPPPQQKVRF